MQIKQDMPVVAANGESVGQVDRVVFDPRSRMLTHLIVRKGIIFNEDKVLPLEYVAEVTEEAVRLRAQVGDLRNMPDFRNTEVIRFVGEEFDEHPYRDEPAFIWYPPVGSSVDSPDAGNEAYTTRSGTSLPEETIGLKTGAPVFDANEDSVGEVEQVRVNETTGKVTHFVVASGLFPRIRKLVPISWIDLVTAEMVRLAVSKRQIEELEEYRI